MSHSSGIPPVAISPDWTAGAVRIRRDEGGEEEEVTAEPRGGSPKLQGCTY